MWDPQLYVEVRKKNSNITWQRNHESRRYIHTSSEEGDYPQYRHARQRIYIMNAYKTGTLT
ncbi:hypothetical protein AX777_10960 [Sphingobium yanoikuyae]|uniref:Uncharacterized protein n=1 Tax=Sphingobium yanoikuyae TaxID=13690 RepID=A0A177JQY6_SPHYA|nr:hypothetical protein AX777_10960 [Sphingobium yanoikuyae]RSU59958.1 hypothetical protein DAH51_06705 [Sphingobium yanoikuyae]